MAIKANLSFTRQDRRLIIGGSLLLLLAMVLFLTLPALVDTHYIERELKTSFKKVTGLDLEIQDGLEVRIFPTPHIVIHNLYVTNVPGAATSFMLSVRTMDVRIYSWRTVTSRRRSSRSIPPARSRSPASSSAIEGAPRRSRGPAPSRT